MNTDTADAKASMECTDGQGVTGRAFYNKRNRCIDIARSYSSNKLLQNSITNKVCKNVAYKDTYSTFTSLIRKSISPRITQISPFAPTKSLKTITSILNRIMLALNYL